MNFKNWLFNAPKKVSNNVCEPPARITTLADLGYELIENNPELSVYRKDEVYGKKMIHVYLSSDCVPLVRCFELVSGDPMSMTSAELEIANATLCNKMMTDWRELFCGE